MTTGIKSWSETAADNDAAPPNGAPEGMAPNAVNDCLRQVMAEVRKWFTDAQWIDFGHAGLSYVDATNFRVTGDKTAIYEVGRRVRAIGTTPFTIYGSISASVYSAPNTTVTVVWDSGTLNNTLSEVAVGSAILGKALNILGVKVPDASIPYTALSGVPAPVNPIPVGAVLPYPFSDVPSGWLQVSNLTIGNASSNATARANADTADLFTKLWNQYDNTRLPILNSAGSASTRGVDAATDYAANKALPLLDMRGYVLAGYDSMGGTSANRLTGISGGVNGDTIGAQGGEETHTLTTGEMPSHSHAATVDSSPGSGVEIAGGGGGSNTNAPSSIQATGGGGAHNNVQPTFVTPFIIKL